MGSSLLSFLLPFSSHYNQHSGGEEEQSPKYNNSCIRYAVVRSTRLCSTLTSSTRYILSTTTKMCPNNGKHSRKEISDRGCCDRGDKHYMLCINRFALLVFVPKIDVLSCWIYVAICTRTVNPDPMSTKSWRQNQRNGRTHCRTVKTLSRRKR